MKNHMDLEHRIHLEVERRWPSPNSGLYEGLRIGFALGARWLAGARSRSKTNDGSESAQHIASHLREDAIIRCASFGPDDALRHLLLALNNLDDAGWEYQVRGMNGGLIVSTKDRAWALSRVMNVSTGERRTRRTVTRSRWGGPSIPYSFPELEGPR